MPGSLSRWWSRQGCVLRPLCACDAPKYTAFDRMTSVFAGHSRYCGPGWTRTSGPILHISNRLTAMQPCLFISQVMLDRGGRSNAFYDWPLRDGAVCPLSYVRRTLAKISQASSDLATRLRVM